MICSKCNRSFDSLTDERLCAECYQQAESRRLGIIELAQEQRDIEGAFKIDDNALLSEGNDNGCYVAAWVWVDFNGTEYDKQKEEDNEQIE